jgi:hypothetical protein
VTGWNKHHRLTTDSENFHRRTPYLDLPTFSRRTPEDMAISCAMRSPDMGVSGCMIYAIAAVVMQITQPYTWTLPERYFPTALHFKSTWQGERSCPGYRGDPPHHPLQTPDVSGLSRLVFGGPGFKDRG